MLTEIITEIRNYFCVSEYNGNFQLTNNSITLTSDIVPKVEQYVYIKSMLNRAVCKVESINGNTFSLTSDIVLVDDEIDFIALLQIPPQFISLCKEIEEWQTNNGSNPLNSESFAGWSGSRSQGKYGNLTWQEMFNSRLKPYMKMFADISEL